MAAGGPRLRLGKAEEKLAIVSFPARGGPKSSFAPSAPGRQAKPQGTPLLGAFGDRFGSWEKTGSVPFPGAPLRRGW